MNYFQKNASAPVQIIPAVRIKNTFERGIKFYSGAGCSFKSPFSFGRIRKAIISQVLLDSYRINQALTFAFMCRVAKFWTPGRWVMTYDADQFYPDSLIDLFDLLRDPEFPYEMLTAKEYTFPKDFQNFTTNYEKRTWNNLPHKISKNMAVYPTRHFMVESFACAKDFPSSCKMYTAGVYHHYKFRRDSKRLAMGYNLGDRVAPDESRFLGLLQADNIEFPFVIKKFFLSSPRIIP